MRRSGALRFNNAGLSGLRPSTGLAAGNALRCAISDAADSWSSGQSLSVRASGGILRFLPRLHSLPVRGNRFMPSSHVVTGLPRCFAYHLNKEREHDSNGT